MRDALIIFVAIILAMLIGSYLFFNDSPRVAPPIEEIVTPASDPSVMLLAEGQDSGSLTRRTNYRITSEEQFAEFWTLVYGASGPARPLIDFTNYDVIAVMDGTHSSGGYGVSVAGISDEEGRRVVHIRREEPGEGCITTEAITSPFQIVRVKKSALPLTKEEEIVTRQCS